MDVHLLSASVPAAAALEQPSFPAAVDPGRPPLSPQLLELEASIVSDPILDLCPSLDLLKALVRSTQVATQIKRQKLFGAVLRASSNGDTDMLSWLLNPRNEARQLIANANGERDTGGRLRVAFDEMRDEDGSGPVVLASCAGHVDAVTILILNGGDVDERDACGWTPLMWATNSSNLTLALFLLEHGADVEARSSKGTTCEDFILSAAPDAAGSSQASGSSNHIERDQLADLIYEYQRSAAAHTSSTQKLRDLSFSSPGPAPGSPQKPASLLSSVDLAPQLGHLQTRPRPSSASTFKSGHHRTNSQLTASRRLVGRDERAHIADQELRAREVAESRKRALLDIAVMLELDHSALLGQTVASPNESNAAASRSTRRKGAPRVTPSTLASGCGAAEVGSDLLSVEFDWRKVRSDQMLVFGLSDLTPLLDRMVTNIRPLRAPWTSRAAPANVIFLCARYACSLGDEELLEELFLGAIDRIEGSIYAHPTDMTYLAFWLYNCCLLHYYTQKDSTLRASEAVAEYRALLSDLLNEIYVFVIRDAERRIDKALDQAILDHEAIPGFEEVRFEGEWKFMRTLAGSVKGISQQGSISAASTASGTGSARRPISQIFGRREQIGSDTSQAGPSTSPSLGIGSPPHGSGGTGRPAAPFKFPNDASPSKRMTGDVLPTMREVSWTATAADLLSSPSPRTITSLLTSTLHVLQLYEINPAIIVQGLSQVFFWIGCELFNRTISRKRYLCRSRAMQIRLNVSALEDWARSNALPLSIVHAHLSPLSQLVSWLQCQSSLNDFDGLIATMQGLKALNPMQMRKAVKDYRYEVGETRMSEECLQYLDQLIIDWKRRQEDQAAQQAMQERAIQQRRKRAAMVEREAEAAGLNISHHRSGTATQDGYTPDSRSPSPSAFGDDYLDGGEYGTDVDINGLGNGGRSRNSTHEVGDTSISSIATAGASEPLTVAEEAARSAQNAIDALFLPGKSMSDYVPPWTAAGAPIGINGRGNRRSSSGTGTGTLFASETLNSRDMLPFALPTRAEAMIVTPGDAFGFGRGHFAGTGTPSLRSVAGSESGSVRSLSSSAASSRYGSRPGSPETSLSRLSSQPAHDDTAEDAESVQSGASNATNTSNASRSSLFPVGKGFAAGGSWCPVPLLPDPLLDEINEIMRQVALLGEKRPSISSDPHPLAAEVDADPARRGQAPPVVPQHVVRIPPRTSSTALNDGFMASGAQGVNGSLPPSPSKRGEMQRSLPPSPLKRREPQWSPTSLLDEQDPGPSQPNRYVEAEVEEEAYDEGALKRRESGLSFKPNRLVIPDRNRVQIQFGDEFDEDEEDRERGADTMRTPIVLTRGETYRA